LGIGKEPFSTPVAGSEVRNKAETGAMLVTTNMNMITFQFYNYSGILIDTYSIQTAQ
jgi:hypothetical protein